jgi:O-antigen/teichoic acid export membrane protein
LQRYSRGGVAADSIALILTSGLTAATGFLFWTLAARTLTPHELGVETALLSLMITAGTIAAIGTGNSFTALLPVPGCARRQRLIDGYVLVAMTSVALGSVAGLIASWTLHLGVASAMSWTVVGSVTMAFFALKDSSMIGLGGAAKLPIQNLLASIAKIALFPLLVTVFAHPAVIATLAAACAAAVVVIGFIIPRLVNVQGISESDAGRLAPTRRDLSVFAARDGIASAMSMGVMLSLPFITTAVAGPVDGAVLALALSVAQALDLVSAGVGTALTAGLAARPDGMWVRVRRAWALTFAAVIVTGVAILAASPLIMAILGSNYREQPIVLVLAVLMLGSIVRVSFVVWASALRAQAKTATLLKVNGFAVTVAVPVILVFTSLWGAVGAAAGLSVGSTILGSIGAIALIRARGGV